MLAVLALGVADAALRVRLERASAINGIAVVAEPCAYFLHAFEARLRDFAIGVGAHVEQKVATLGDDIAEHVNQSVGRLVVVVVDKRPAVAHSHASLPRIREDGVGHLFFGSAIVLIFAAYAAVDNQEVGVVLASHASDFRPVDVLDLSAASEPLLRLLVEAPSRADPSAVEPKDVDVAVVVSKLANLVIGEVAIFAPSFGVLRDVVVDIAVGGSPFRSCEK